ncbi:MAG: polysaccharide biosynthesis/export family protein [Pyrinomonadaceae bacterium]
MRNFDSKGFSRRRLAACSSWALLIVAGTWQTATAQQLATTPSPAAPPSLTASPSPAATRPPDSAVPTPASSVTDDRYRIGVGDVLDIRIFNRPQLSREAVRVDGHGEIRMPLIDGEIKAACRTESELESEIARVYLKYQKNPHVDVFVKEYQSQPVAVIGAVKSPGRFQLQRRVRLLELLTFVGGPSDLAGRNIQIVHTTGPSICEKPESANVSDDPLLAIALVDLSETMHGIDKSNPFVKPGDIISIPEADQIYIIGNVVKPSPIALKEQITLSQAIAISGGTLPDTKTERIRIVRQTPGSTTKTEIFANLKAINKHQSEDIVLLANDIVEVSKTTGPTKVLKDIFRTIVPTVGQLPVRAIP